MIELYNQDNIAYEDSRLFDIIYCDMIYEDRDIHKWVLHWWNRLKENGIFIIQTDWHTDWLIRGYFDSCFKEDAVFINHLVWKNEFGNFPKDRFHQCYDSIIIYSKGKDHKFYSDRIQVPKATAKTKLNPSGRQTKTATAWIDDICLTTTSKERVKTKDGKCIRWQKPLKLFDRILSPFCSEGDLIADPFAGSGTLGVWCKQNNRNYVGIENNPEVYNLAKERIDNCDIPVQVQQLQINF